MEAVLKIIGFLCKNKSLLLKWIEIEYTQFWHSDVFAPKIGKLKPIGEASYWYNCHFKGC